MERILITGGAGFIESALARTLIARSKDKIDGNVVEHSRDQILA